MNSTRWLHALAFILAHAATCPGEETDLRRASVCFVNEDNVKALDESGKPLQPFSITFHAGSRVRIIEISEGRVLVHAIDRPTVPPGGWIERHVLQKAKPPAEEEKMPDGLGDMAERKKILGTWRIVSDESRGVELVPTDPRAGHRYWRFAEKEAVTWTQSDRRATRYPGFHIDPSASPKQLDILNSDGRNTIYQTGIYKFEGDKLIWVRDTTARKGDNEPRKRIIRTFRPTGYRTRPGDGRQRMVLERPPDADDAAVPPDERSP